MFPKISTCTSAAHLLPPMTTPTLASTQCMPNKRKLSRSRCPSPILPEFRKKSYLTETSSSPNPKPFFGGSISEVARVYYNGPRPACLSTRHKNIMEAGHCWSLLLTSFYIRLNLLISQNLCCLGPKVACEMCETCATNTWNLNHLCHWQPTRRWSEISRCTSSPWRGE